ncbi:citrate/2-methylcitrate synthase [Virgibacillus byunsanensis]|uniref:Citrate synthase n=1 Tax=Virgibacillus byunsanensis TaxID=570945 RepID=A0ABW3LT25_9BACI
MYKPGLKGIKAVETELSYIDGGQGILSYRGLLIDDIVKKYSFEEVAFYLLHGEFPEQNGLNDFCAKLTEYREIPNHVKWIIDSLPASHSIMDVLRTAISSVTLASSDKTDHAMKLISIMPSIVAYRYRQINNKSIFKSRNDLNHIENFLYKLTGNINQNHAKMLEAYMIMTMEHGLNASTFSARVTISTESDMVSAITSAIGTMKGPLHGGAPSGVIELLNEIQTEDKISEIIHKKLQNKERIMGFGHRVYKTLDPRATALKEIILQLDEIPDWVNLALKTEIETIKILQSLKPDQKLYTNVEYYAAAIMKSLEIDPELFTAIFSSSRIVGWCAHTIEQSNNNTIFRPTAKYIGV